MLKERIPETNEGIQNEVDVEAYNNWMREMSKEKWFKAKDIVESGINFGNCLEIGPGPGFLGLEWLKKTENTFLTAVEISDAMIEVSKRNFKEANMLGRVNYIHANAMDIPLENESFEGAFSNGSLHEWEDPVKIFNEIFRLLKPGSKAFVSDLRRDMNKIMFNMLKMSVREPEIKKGFITSWQSSYTAVELEKIIGKTSFKEFQIKEEPAGLIFIGKKF